MGLKFQLLPKPERVLILFSIAQQPPEGQGLLIIEASRWHSDTPHSEDSSGRVVSPSPRPPPDSTQHLQDIHVSGEIEPEFPTSERPQSYVLNRAFIGVRGFLIYNALKYVYNLVVQKGRLLLKERRSIQCTAAGSNVSLPFSLQRNEFETVWQENECSKEKGHYYTHVIKNCLYLKLIDINKTREFYERNIWNCFTKYSEEVLLLLLLLLNKSF